MNTTVGAPVPRLPLFLKGAASGVLMSLTFPTLDAWFVALIGMIPLWMTLEGLVNDLGAGRNIGRGRAFVTGLGFGLGLYAPLLWWLVLLDAPALTIPWIRYPAPFLVASVEALAPGGVAAAYVFLRTRTRIPGAILGPALWVTGEWMRGTGDLGFPWGVLGYSQVAFLPTLQLAALVGNIGVTFWLVTINVLLAQAILGRPHRVLRLGVATALVVGSLAYGTVRLRQPSNAPTVRVALVQPNVKSRDKWAVANRAGLFEAMADLSRQGVAQGAQLVLWPETAAPCYLLKDREWRPYVEDLARELATPFFIGLPDYAVTMEGSEKHVTYTNSAALFGPDGELAGRMDKIRLVPFGERVPFTGVLPFVDRIDFGEADFIPGVEPVVFDVEDWSFGNLICFEAIFPNLAREYTKRGADILVNITNDSWFGAGAGAIAHKNMAVMRCVETGNGMARCANSGISVGIDAWGRTSGETDLFVRTVSVVDVPLRQGETLFMRTGDWIGWGSRIGVLLLLFWGVVRGRRMA